MGISKWISLLTASLRGCFNAALDDEDQDSNIQDNSTEYLVRNKCSNELDDQTRGIRFS